MLRFIKLVESFRGGHPPCPLLCNQVLQEEVWGPTCRAAQDSRRSHPLANRAFKATIHEGAALPLPIAASNHTSGAGRKRLAGYAILPAHRLQPALATIFRSTTRHFASEAMAFTSQPLVGEHERQSGLRSFCVRLSACSRSSSLVDMLSWQRLRVPWAAMTQNIATRENTIRPVQVS